MAIGQALDRRFVSCFLLGDRIGDKIGDKIWGKIGDMR